MSTGPTFEIEITADVEPGETLVMGLSNLGLAGLSAVDYLVRHLEFERIGHVKTHGLPDMAPFENGEPRYPMRVYGTEDANFSVLVSELFLPVWAADPFATALRGWVTESTIEEVAVLHGVPFPHGPDEHEVFYVATPGYRERRLASEDIRPLSGGVLDGVVGELVIWGLADDAPPVGVYVAPTHPPGPDFDVALLFLDALQNVYEFTVDEAELRQMAEDLERHYDELADRLQTMQETEQGLRSRDEPEDRMFM